MKLVCVKCAVQVVIRADDIKGFDVRGPEQEDWRMGNALPCPFCLLNRGGHYPLVRVRRLGGAK